MALTYIKSSGLDTTSTYTFGNVSVTGNITSGNATLGNLATATYLTGTLTTNAQPNITSVGTLTSLTASGLITATSGGIKVGNLQDTSGTNTIQLLNSNVSVTGNITAGTGGTGNVTATYYIGNGSQLTGLPATYANSNVAAYLPTYTGNFAGGNVFTDHLLYANGQPWVMGGGNYVTRNYVATGSSNTYTVTNGCNVDNVLVFINGICQAPTDDYTITTTTLTVSGTPTSGAKIQIRELPR
jgi:hypothetical protein